MWPCTNTFPILGSDPTPHYVLPSVFPLQALLHFTCKALELFVVLWYSVNITLHKTRLLSILCGSVYSEIYLLYSTHGPIWHGSTLYSTLLYAPVQAHTSKYCNYYATTTILISMLQWEHSQEEVPLALTLPYLSFPVFPSVMPIYFCLTHLWYYQTSVQPLWTFLIHPQYPPDLGSC